MVAWRFSPALHPLSLDSGIVFLVKCCYTAWDWFAEEGGEVFQVAGFTSRSPLGGLICCFIRCEVTVTWHPMDVKVANTPCSGFKELVTMLGSMEVCFSQDLILFVLEMFCCTMDLV